MKKATLKGYVYDFSVYYDAIEVSNKLNTHKYLMEKNEIVQYKNVQVYQANNYFSNDVFWQSIKRESIRMYFNEESRM